jgi:hypothetical protein
MFQRYRKKKEDFEKRNPKDNKGEIKKTLNYLRVRKKELESILNTSFSIEVFRELNIIRNKLLIQEKFLLSSYKYCEPANEFHILRSRGYSYTK